MKARPETVFYDYVYDNEADDVIAMTEEPCDAKFWTSRADDWSQVCLTYYRTRHSNGKLVKPPEMKQQRNGSQILVPDNNDCDNACYVTIHVYHTGVVLIQGRGCATWEVDDMPDIKSLLPNVLPEPCQSDTSIINSPCQPVPVSPIRPDDSIKSSRPRTLVSRLYQAASLIISSSFSTPKSAKLSTTSQNTANITLDSTSPCDLSDTALLQHGGDISLCLDLLEDCHDDPQGADNDTHCELEINSSTEQSEKPGVASVQLIPQPTVAASNSVPKSTNYTLPPPAASHYLTDKLKDAQHTITTLTSANDRLREENQQLRLDKDTAASRYAELTDEIAVLRAKVLSLAEEKKIYTTVNRKRRAAADRQQHVPRSNDVLLITSSMGRHVARQLNVDHQLSSTSFVYPGAGCYRLSEAVTRTQRQAKPYNPKLVVLAGGTNDIGAGEDAKTVSEGIDHLLQTTKATYPQCNIVFSGIHHRTDSSSKTNKTIDEVNRLAKSSCQRRGHIFIENNLNSSVNTPDVSRLKPDGLHLNPVGVSQLAGRIASVLHTLDTTVPVNGGSTSHKMVNNIHTNAKLTIQPQQRKIRNPPPDFSRQRHNLVPPGAAIIRQTTGQSTDPPRHRVVLRDKSQPMIPALPDFYNK